MIYCTRPNIYSFSYSSAPRPDRVELRKRILDLKNTIEIDTLPDAIKRKFVALENFKGDDQSVRGSIGSAAKNIVAPPVPLPTFATYDFKHPDHLF